MNAEELRSRAAEIRSAVNEEGADLEALDKEATEIAARLAKLDVEKRRRRSRVRSRTVMALSCAVFRPRSRRNRSPPPAPSTARPG